jgi:hypothetical protein
VVWTPQRSRQFLFVCFTYTNQTRKVIDVMAEVLRGRGIDVTLAAIGFTDPRYEGRFEEFPMPHPFRELVGMIPAESPRRRPAKIEIPDVVTEREYDLVCIGSPPGGCPPTSRSAPSWSPTPRARS